MSEAPREAVEFARMVVRAFYADEFVVLMDAVLRMNNFCAHGLLAQRLSIPPKELRQMLNRMVQARLMKSDKRQQKKVNIHDERRGTRLVTTEFWYVPLGSVVDSFIFRVHKMTREIEKRRATEREQHKWICERCGSHYQLLDILQWSNNPDGSFVCEKIGVRADRRPYPCGGRISEEDNSSAIKETERVKQMLDEELRILRERANVCANMDIPNHPLLGADEKKWDEYAPETVGANGEKVDEDGVPIEQKEAAIRAKEEIASSSKIPSTGNPINDDAIPEKPSWFKDSQPEDADDDWDYEQENVVDIKKGTAASINADAEKVYMEQYLRQIGGLPPETKEDDAVSTTLATPDPHKDPTKTDKNEIQPASVQLANNQDSSNENEQDVEEDVIVYVAGKPVKLSQVTEDMHMTDEEYLKFVEAQRSVGGAHDVDDDDMD